jgi:hypothetical protein
MRRSISTELAMQQFRLHSSLSRCHRYYVNLTQSIANRVTAQFAASSFVC